MKRLALVPLACFLAGLAPAQEPQPVQPVIHIPVPQAGEDLHQQILDLIGKTELRLRRIDALLAEAGVAGRETQPLKRTADCVRRSQEEGREVVEAIDKILELANTPHHPPGQGHGA